MKYDTGIIWRKYTFCEKLNNYASLSKKYYPEYSKKSYFVRFYILDIICNTKCKTLQRGHYAT